MPFATERGVSLSRYSASSSIKDWTSAWGRRQLSAEKANSVRTPIPRSGAASTTRLTFATPATCPAVRGKPRDAAQRPLPSIMIPACKVLVTLKFMGTKKDPYFSLMA